MRQFINDPPKFSPPGVFHEFRYLSKRYENKTSVPEQIEQVIAWAEKEYHDALVWATEKGSMNHIRFLSDEFSPVRFLSVLTVFDVIINYMNENPLAWKSLDRHARRFLTDAYDFRKLSNQRIA